MGCNEEDASHTHSIYSIYVCSEIAPTKDLDLNTIIANHQRIEKWNEIKRKSSRECGKIDGGMQNPENNVKRKKFTHEFTH